MRTLQISISAPEPDMNEFCFVAEEIAETFMKAKDAHLLMAQDCFLKNYPTTLRDIIFGGLGLSESDILKVFPR